MSAEPPRYLVLCVDRDDDLGVKANVKAPVVGREATVDAAMKLSLADPEEADANAIFATVKKFDELAGKGTKCEVAIVCGDSKGGFDADKKVGEEVKDVLGQTKATGIVFVSDGADDEQVMPILQSLKPIVSVHRVTVKHSQTVEETYLVLGRYLRMLIFDPRYSKWTLGVPGVIFLLAGILILLSRVFEAELATLLILGATFFIKGFGVDKAVAELIHRGPTGYIRLFSAVTSALVLIVGIFTGYGYMQENAGFMLPYVLGNPSLFLVYGAKIIGYFLSGSLVLVWAGMVIYSTGAFLSHVARDSIRWRRDAYVILMLALLYFPVSTFSSFLIQGGAEATFLLVSYVLLGLAAIFALTVAIYPRVRTKGPEQKE